MEADKFESLVERRRSSGANHQKTWRGTGKTLQKRDAYPHKPSR